MSGSDLTQAVMLLATLVALAIPLGHHLADILQGRTGWTGAWLGGLERACLRAAGVDPGESMDWKSYALAMLAFNAVGVLAVYGIERSQAWLPMNAARLPGVVPHIAFNAAVSFASNTNWQSYAGESVLTPFTQMAAMTVQNFLSAATGIAVCAASIRGFAFRRATALGNFWVDLVRVTVHVLLPLSFVLAIVLVSQGVVQTFAPRLESALTRPVAAAGGARGTQTIPLGPVASQEAIKQLGTNGGGWYNANSAHPFENPTPLSNAAEWLAILLLPAALCFAFGRMVGDPRQGVALFAAMFLLLAAALAAACWAETRPNPALLAAGATATPPGHVNLEGKETRFGVVPSVLWAVATTAASNGSVNAMHDSLTPLGGLVAMVLIQLGEVVFGGVGSGLYGMFVFAIVTVFLAGLMVGRTPEYLGKKLEAFEIKMASLVILLPAMAVLLGSALAVSVPAGIATLGNPGPHGFSEILYAFSSAANNNGSAFAGLGAATPFYDVLLGLAMFVGRWGVAIPVLAMAGSLAAKPRLPEGAGTLPTHTPLFVVLLVGVVVIVGALTFLPALALGPIVEHLQLARIAAPH